jgi:hypothetical protein
VPPLGAADGIGILANRKPQCHYERTSKLIQMQGLRQNSAQVLRYRSGGPEKTSLLDRGQQAGAGRPAAFQSAIPLKSGRHCPIKPAAAAVSAGQPENSTETPGSLPISRNIRSASGINQGYQRGRLCGASDSVPLWERRSAGRFRRTGKKPPATTPQNPLKRRSEWRFFANWKTSAPAPGNPNSAPQSE